MSNALCGAASEYYECLLRAGRRLNVERIVLDDETEAISASKVSALTATGALVATGMVGPRSRHQGVFRSTAVWPRRDRPTVPSQYAILWSICRSRPGSLGIVSPSIPGP